MWKMTLKQRRRHGELMSQLRRLQLDPYMKLPVDYTNGENPDEDEKYAAALETLKAVVEEIHELEVAGREGS
ncbi:MAG: hypothetical protein CMQ11_06520 [Gammaproteobacteria bacterium]|nr:hypothetical protein [Gammaproteobacteria bacterium]